MFRDLEDQNDRMQEAAVENGRKQTLAAIYAKHPQLIICTSNDNRIIGAIQEWVGSTMETLVPSPTYFEAALSENGPDFFKQFATQSTESAREEAIREILSLLKENGSGYDDPHNLATEKSRLSRISLEGLRLRLGEIRERQRMAGLPVSVLKRQLAASRKDVRKYEGYPDLPPTMWDAELGKHVKIDRAWLQSQSAFSLRRLNRLYGDPQIFDRLNGK